MSRRSSFTPVTSRANVDAQRKRELGLIHMGRCALGWSEEDYRYHLVHQTGKASAAELDAAGRRQLLDHMAACGWTPKRSFRPFGQADKIKWLWRKLGDAGALRETGDQALLAFVGHTTGMGVSNVKFLPVHESSTVIEALKSWLGRAQRAQDAASQ